MEDALIKDIADFYTVMRHYRLAVTPWINSRLLAKLGITLQQSTVLCLLAETGEIRMGQLAAKLGTTMGAVTSLVDRLVHAEMIERERSTEDRRVVKVKLSAKGRRVLDEAHEDGKVLFTDIFRQIAPADRRTYLEVQGEVARLLREKWEQTDRSVEVEE